MYFWYGLFVFIVNSELEDHTRRSTLKEAWNCELELYADEKSLSTIQQTEQNNKKYPKTQACIYCNL